MVTFSRKGEVRLWRREGRVNCVPAHNLPTANEPCGTREISPAKHDKVSELPEVPCAYQGDARPPDTQCSPGTPPWLGDVDGSFIQDTMSVAGGRPRNLSTSGTISGSWSAE